MKQILIILIFFLILSCSLKHHYFKCIEHGVKTAKVIYNSKTKLFEYTGYELGEYGFNTRFLECYYNEKNEYFLKGIVFKKYIYIGDEGFKYIVPDKIIDILLLKRVNNNDDFKLIDILARTNTDGIFEIQVPINDSLCIGIMQNDTVGISIMVSDIYYYK